MIDEQIVTKIIESYRNGYGYRTIGDHFGISAWTVRYHVKRSKIETRGRGRPPGSKDVRPRAFANRNREAKEKPKRERERVTLEDKRIRRAISSGFIEVKTHCDFCGSEGVEYQFTAPYIYDLRWRCEKHR